MIALVAAGACSDADGSGPEVLQLNPSEASPGGTVDILGERFCGELGVLGDSVVCMAPPAASVHIGSESTVVRGDSLRWEDERITIELPDDVAVGVTVLTVSVEGLVSNTVDFLVVP